MTKKLLPAMIGMILVGGVAVAQADVQLMGHIDEAFNYAKGGNGDSPAPGEPKTNYWPYISQGDSNSEFVCTTCSVGVKGSEDLGNGLKALFFLDWQYDINGNGGAYSHVYEKSANETNGGLKGRDQWVGLGGGFGTMKVGTMSTVYKSYGAMLDPAYRTIAQQRDIGLQSQLHSGRGDYGQGRATNTVRYDSPDWKGLQLSATYTVQPDSDQANDMQGHPYSAGVKYENGGLLGFVTYLNNGSGGDQAATAVGAKWTIDKFSIFGQYEFDQGLITDVNTGTLGQDNNGDGADVWMAGGTYTMGNNTLYAGYGAQTDSAKTTNVDPNNPFGVGEINVGKYKSWTVVGIHSFSKSTLAYIGYVGFKPDNSDIDTVSDYTVGVKHTF